MAGRAIRPDNQPDRVLIAIDPDLDDVEKMSLLSPFCHSRFRLREKK